MPSKTKIGIICGITILIAVASLMGLPLIDSDISMQNLPNRDIQLQESEEKMLEFIEHQKAELEWKIGGKISP